MHASCDACSSSRGQHASCHRIRILQPPRFLSAIVSSLDGATVQYLLTSCSIAQCDTIAIRGQKEKTKSVETIKQTFREHGKVFVLYYTATWLGGFGVAFGGVTLAGLDGVALLRYLGADSVIDTTQFSTRVVNALIAAEINELFEFVRLPLVITTTPALSRRLRRRRCYRRRRCSRPGTKEARGAEVELIGVVAAFVVGWNGRDCAFYKDASPSRMVNCGERRRRRRCDARRSTAVSDRTGHSRRCCDDRCG